MKKMKATMISKLWMGIFTLTTLLVCACEEKGGTDAPAFPNEVATYTVAAGDKVTISFTANTNWQLSSDAMWCKVDGFLDTYGKAGEQNVVFTISADGQSVDDAKANITLRMGDQQALIAIITRAGIANAIVLGNDSIDYKHGQTLLIGPEGMASLIIKEMTFDANSLYPSTTAEWLNLDREGDVITLSVKPEFVKYSQTNETDSICFSDKDVPMLRLHVEYTGMEAQKIVLEPATQWGIQVSADGLTYKNSLYDMSQEIYDAPIQVSVAALNDAYTLYYALYDKEEGCKLITPDAELWYTVTDDASGNLTISFAENTDNERTGYLFVLPNAVDATLNSLNEVAGFLLVDTTGINEVRAECEQYLIAEFTQESILAGSFHLIDGPTFEYLEVALETEEMWVEFAQSYGIAPNNLFKAELVFAHPYILNPMFPLAEWDPSVGNGDIQVLGVSGTMYTSGEDYLEEPTLMEAEGEDNMLIQFRSYIEETYIIIFVDANKIAHKALVVTPNLD
jgi:hypothetical protein